jgi:hypothetical protein
MVEILNYRNALPLGTSLLEYRLDSVLGAGGFGMTYLGYDTLLEKKVAIKEYLPVELAVRAPDGKIIPVNSGSDYNYKWGLERFLQEARLLARFSHPNIVTVVRYFEANGTAYMVMNYESGLSLSQLLKRVPQPDEAMLMRILLPLLDGLQAVHEAGFLHRDIKPSNLFIRDNGQPVLLDFGSARVATGATTRTITSILTPGYAPLEQYSKDGNQGPWTDIYSLAAVLYRVVVGDNPPDVVTRLKDDTVLETLSAARDRFDQGFLHAIHRGLDVDEKKRPQSVPQWRAMFTGEAYAGPPAAPVVAGDAAEPQTRRIDAATTALAPRRRRMSMTQMTAFAAGALALYLMIGGAELLDRYRHRAPAGGAPPATLTPREFYLLDRDRSGFLTPDEVKGDQVIEQAFGRLDRNRDGRLSLEEFIATH